MAQAEGDCWFDLSVCRAMEVPPEERWEELCGEQDRLDDHLRTDGQVIQHVPQFLPRPR